MKNIGRWLILIFISTQAVNLTIISGQARGEENKFGNLEEMLPTEAVVKHINITPFWSSSQKSGLFWMGVIPSQLTPTPTDFIAVHFSNFMDTSGVEWRLLLKDKDGIEVAKFSKDKIFPDGRKTVKRNFWSDDIPGHLVTVELYADRNPKGLSFVIDKYLYEHREVAIKSIINPDDPHIEDMANFRGIEPYYRPSVAVTKVSITDEFRRFSCTGFLLSENLVITNEHCLPRQMTEDCDGLVVHFGYETGTQRMEKYQCVEVVLKNYPLDYALLRISGNPGTEWGVLELNVSRELCQGEKLFVIQHPGGRPKQIALQGCTVANSPVQGRQANPREDIPYTPPQDFCHTCDTEGGSSGSPVFDERGLVVGLHHYGFPPNAEIRLNQAILFSEILASFPSEIRVLLRSR